LKINDSKVSLATLNQPATTTTTTNGGNSIVNNDEPNKLKQTFLDKIDTDLKLKKK
jgi:hypothetical protein